MFPLFNNRPLEKALVKNVLAMVTLILCDGVDYQESEFRSDPEIMENLDNKGDCLLLQISKEGQAFLEATFGSQLEFATRKAKLAKYKTPDYIWLKCLELCSVHWKNVVTAKLQDRVEFPIEFPSLQKFL